MSGWGQAHGPKINPAVFGPIPELRTAAPLAGSTLAVRCIGKPGGRPCNRLLAELVTTPWRIVCPKCHHVNEG